MRARILGVALAGLWVVAGAMGQESRVVPRKQQPRPAEARPVEAKPRAVAPAATPRQPAEGEAAQPGIGEMDPEQMMQMWIEMNRPTEEHERLRAFEGTWDAEATMTMPGMDEPVTTTSVQVNEMSLDGRFLRMEHRGEFAGQPMQGAGYMGYNTVTKEHEGLWMDSMSTGMFMSTGTYDAETKSWEMRGSVKNPMGEGTIEHRYTLTTPADGKYTMVMYEKYPGTPEMGTMTIVYTKRKDQGGGR